MLLINNDDTNGLKGRKDGGARADDNGNIPSENSVPLVQEFAFGELAVKYGNTIAKPGPETPFRLGDKRNFRHQHNSALSIFFRQGDQTHIDFGFTAAGDTG